METSTTVAQHDWTSTNGRIPGHRCQVCQVYAAGEMPPTESKPCPGNVTVFVRFDGEHSLAVGEVWPDGDYPDEITAEAVIKAMGRHDLQRDWNLDFDTYVSVGLGEEVRRR